MKSLIKENKSNEKNQQLRVFNCFKQGVVCLNKGLKWSSEARTAKFKALKSERERKNLIGKELRISLRQTERIIANYKRWYFSRKQGNVTY